MKQLIHTCRSSPYGVFAFSHRSSQGHTSSIEIMLCTEKKVSYCTATCLSITDLLQLQTFSRRLMKKKRFSSSESGTYIPASPFDKLSVLSFGFHFGRCPLHNIRLRHLLNDDHWLLMDGRLQSHRLRVRIIRINIRKCSTTLNLAFFLHTTS